MVKMKILVILLAGLVSKSTIADLYEAECIDSNGDDPIGESMERVLLDADGHPLLIEIDFTNFNIDSYIALEETNASLRQICIENHGENFNRIYYRRGSS